jgi:sarcosine reductase
VSPTPADLQIATFAIGEIVEGTQTGRDADTLVVSIPKLAVGAGEPALAEATVEIVRPGELVRIANVLDVVLSVVKHDDPSSTFPGVLGDTTSGAGSGRTDRLEGVGVLSVCDWLAAGCTQPEEFPDAFIDMAGPGQDATRWGTTTNVVLRCIPTPGVPLEEVDAAVRRSSLRLARDLASIVVDTDPSDISTFARPASGADPTLPSIVVILQIASEGPLTDTFLYGAHMRSHVSTRIDPLEILDGALTNGAYDWAAVRNVTAAYQDCAMIRELLAGHGERLRFAGLIVAPGYLDTAQEKQRSAEKSAELARRMGADGVICTTFSSGNSHTDTMLTVRACERQGIATTAIVSETNGGLTDHVPEADCIVSTGNEDTLIDAWTPQRVIGAEEARAGEPVPLWAYVGACVETGDMTWTAVPA